jgi:hypothetical protein
MLREWYCRGTSVGFDIRQHLKLMRELFVPTVIQEVRMICGL